MTTVLHVMEASGFGTGRHLTDLVSATPEIDHVVALPPRRVRRGDPPRNPTADRLRALGAVVHDVPMRRVPVHPVNVPAWWRLRRLVRALAPDVVHGHATGGGALARAVALGESARCIYTPHALLPSAVATAAERMMGRVTHRIVALSPGEAELLVRRGISRPERITVIPNGLDLSEPVGPPTVDLRARFALDDRPVVGFVGRLAPQKAPEHAVAAVSELRRTVPDAHLVMLAAGPQLGEIERSIEDLDLVGRVHLAGYVRDAETVLHQFDVLLQPSRWEGGPYVPLEAMRAGVPLVLSDCVGNRDVVEPGVSGEVVPVGDVAGFADALSRVLREPGRAARMTEAATRRLHDRFDLRVTSRAYLDLWRP